MILLPKKFLLLTSSLLVLHSIPAHAADWPHWRGAGRNAITTESSGWNDSTWPTVKPLWHINVGEGAAAPIVIGNHVYFFGWSDNHDHIRCVDFATGKMNWLDGKIGDAGSCLLTSDKRLIVWGNGGDLSLVEGYSPSREKFRLLAEKKKLFDDMAWPHIVLSGGHLFCKVLAGDVICFSVE